MRRGDGPAGATRILVIEDDDDFREALCTTLRDRGYAVDDADAGEVGIDRALSSPPHLVLCDVRMPGMGGHEVLTRLRTHAKTSKLPFIFLSATADLRAVRAGMRLGADDYLAKPISEPDLLDAIEARLRRHAMELPPTRDQDDASQVPSPPRRRPTRENVVAGRYEIVRCIARGGTSSVYHARDNASGDEVALKLLNDAHGPTSRFERECAALAALRCPRIVRYRDHGITENGRRYLVMDWLPGHDLATHLSQGPLGVEDTLKVLRRSADALAVVHAAGLVHRDVKPSNLFLRDGSIDALTLIDFGIAKSIDADAIMLVGEVVGTPGFLAPEQLDVGGLLDASADVFALGCTVWACLLGASPFRGESVGASIARAMSPARHALMEYRSDVPVALDALVAAMIHRDPAKRFSNGGAVLDALAALNLA